MKKKYLTARAIFLVLACLCFNSVFAEDLLPNDSDHPSFTIYNENYILINKIMAKYGVDKEEAATIVKVAEEKAYPDFPTKKDILSIIAIESSFNKRANSGISLGLMQINFLANRKRFKKKSDLFDIEKNIEIGVGLLREYYEQLGSRKKAIQAYNVGIGNFLSGLCNRSYLHKFLSRKAWLGG